LIAITTIAQGLQMENKIEKTITRTIDLFPSGGNFLVLEDMDAIRAQLVKDLASVGVQGKIYEAPNVQAAIKICDSEKIDFIISDWNLPDGNGHDFLKKIRTIERYKKTPFIMCTTKSEVNFILEAIASGASDFIVKPWNLDELKKKISMVWKSHLDKKNK